MDASEIKVGERYRIEAEVEVFDVLSPGGDYGHKVHVRGLSSDCYAVAAVDPKHFVSRIERPIAVGDRVRLRPVSSGIGTLIGLDGGHAWIKWDRGSYGSWNANDVERVP